MTTTLTITNPETQGASAPAPTPSTSQWGQVSGGPQAYAFPAILKLMDVLMQLMKMYNEQANYQVDTQIASAQSAAHATKDAAQAQANVTWCQAANAFATAGISVGTMMLQNRATQGTQSDINALNAHANDLHALDAPVRARLAGGPAAREVGPNGQRTPEIEAQINELKNGHFNRETLATDASYKEAIAHMDNDEVTAFSKHLAEVKTQVSQQTSGKNTEISQIRDRYNMFKDMANTAAAIATKAGEASCQTDAGIKNGVAGLAQTNKEIAQSMHSATEKSLGDAYTEAMQALSMLQQIAASGRGPV